MKRSIIHFIILGIYISLLALGACSKSNTPPPIPVQGPKNPSFETDGYVSYYNQNSSSYVYVDVGAYWEPAADYIFGTYSRSTGNGFMPTQGHYYALLTNFESNGSASHVDQLINFYQDSVDLSHSTTMTFDYTLQCGSPDIDGVNGTVVNTSITAAVVFQSYNSTYYSSGTDTTLWQQTITATSTWSSSGGTWNTVTSPAAPIQKLNQVITLPSLPVMGTLSFQLTAATPGNTTGYLYPKGTFCVDNIRVH